MKPALLSLVIALLMVGCGDGTVDQSDLEYRNGVAYLPNEETPFTGRAERFYENGQKRESSYKDGKAHGLMTVWYENGQKMKEENYKDGKLMSAVQWKPNGQKCPVTDIKDGNGVWVWYTEDGTENTRTTYKDGERVRN